jgi:phthiocerol/phenolphthiocerol synthesis type-I polyketide synthase E
VRETGEAVATDMDPSATEVSRQGSTEQRIAVIGMAGRFPGARDEDAFWQLLAEGREGLTRFGNSDLAAAGAGADADPALVPVTGPLERPADFDAEFFGFTPAEAEVTDPQHRLFLECASASPWRW